MAQAAEVGERLKGKVEDEAARAEAEAPEPEPEAQPADEPKDDTDPEAAEPEPEPEPSARKGKSPQERFQAAFSRFVKTAAECFEVPPAEVAIAPHPGVVGIMLPGFAEPRTHEDFKRCETCNGLGKVLTGAVTGDAAKDTHVCPDLRCKGNGFWTKQQQQQAAPETGPLSVVTPPTGNGEWGEAPAWMGDPSLTPQHS